MPGSGARAAALTARHDLDDLGRVATHPDLLAGLSEAPRAQDPFDPNRQDQARRAGSLADDAHLWRLVHAERQADRQLARGLAALWGNELYRRLGFVRATDFVREHLGIKEGRARWLAKLGQRLDAIPELDQALAAGRVNASQVIELSKIVSPTTPSAERLAWIERAAGKTVRVLHREVLTELRRLKEASSEDPNPADGSGDIEDDPVVAPSADLEAPPRGGWMSIAAPAHVAALWHEAVDLARAASGRHLSQGQCAELIFAEYLSAFGHEGFEESAPGGAEPGRDERNPLLEMVIEALNSGRARLIKPDPTAAGIDETWRHAAARSAAVAAVAEAAAAEAAAVARVAAVSSSVPDIRLPEGCVVEEDRRDAWALAATLARLSDFKKRLRYDIAGLLKRMRETVDWRALGFASFGEYCEDRLGFGLRRAERLIRFRDGLEKFQRLKGAYLEGGVSYTAALLLLPIVHPSTEELWVAWAQGLTYRELERVAEVARTFALPEAHPDVLASWVKGLIGQGLACKGETDSPQREPGEATAFAVEDAHAAAARVDAAPPPATAFAPGNAPTGEIATEGIPLGCALPPSTPGALPTIVGIPTDLAFADPELCVTRIRFWLPDDARALAHRALDRCRRLMPDPLGDTWVYLQVILVHFIQSQDTPAAREIKRRNKIITRDKFWCRIPGCTSRANLNAHHLHYRSRRGSEEGWNQATGCAGHHGPGVHAGVVEWGGWAPHALTTRLGIDPRTGRALACYQNERRVPEEEAKAALDAWRQWLRERRAKTGGSLRRVAMR